MPRLTIDGKPVDVPAGSSVLDAARTCGLDIPSLCYRSGYHPMTSCMLCLVRLKPSNRIVPSCATPAEDGMEVESETPEIRALRRTGLELLLSDHAGDCAAPCEHACPLGVDLPAMLRQVAAGEFQAAITTIRREMALPAVLGRVCDACCEKGCRRAQVDSPASICLIKRFVADTDLASGRPYLPPRRPSTAKRVAIVGAGPAGLSAAYHLLVAGYACVLFEQCSTAGGMLRTDFDASVLPADVLDEEILLIERLGAEFRLATPVEDPSSLRKLLKQFDAVVLATGPVQPGRTDVLGLPVVDGCIKSDRATHQADLPGVFVAGNAARLNRAVVRAVADAKAAAACVDQYLTTGSVHAPQRPFAVRLGRLSPLELSELMKTARPADRIQPAAVGQGVLSEQEARAEAQRCLHCDCGAKDDCRLRHYAQSYGARPGEYSGRRRPLGRQLQGQGVVYEPGKCILCGLCVQVTQRAGEKLGLTFVGRGFDLRVDVPFARPLSDALRQSAAECVAVCPSGALSNRPCLGCGECHVC